MPDHQAAEVLPPQQQQQQQQVLRQRITDLLPIIRDELSSRCDAVGAPLTSLGESSMSTCEDEETCTRRRIEQEARFVVLSCRFFFTECLRTGCAVTPQIVLAMEQSPCDEVTAVQSMVPVGTSNIMSSSIEDVCDQHYHRSSCIIGDGSGCGDGDIAAQLAACDVPSSSPSSSPQLLGVAGDTQRSGGGCTGVSADVLQERQKQQPTQDAVYANGEHIGSTPGQRQVSKAEEGEDQIMVRYYRFKHSPWRAYRTFVSATSSVLPECSTSPSGDAAATCRYRLSLPPTPPHLSFTGPLLTVYGKPRGYAEKDIALTRQERICADCLSTLRPLWCCVRRDGFLSWGSAHFCYYTGLYYCDACRDADGGETAVIPAHLIFHWDCTPLPVCHAAANFLTLHMDKPLYNISELRPELYALEPLLDAVHLMRKQLMRLREVGIHCPVFRELFYRETALEPPFSSSPSVGGIDTTTPAVVQQPTGPTVAVTAVAAAKSTAFALDEEEAKCYIPLGQRYRIEGSELWSLRDLVEVHRYSNAGGDGKSARSRLPVGYVPVSVQQRHRHSVSSQGTPLPLRSLPPLSVTTEVQTPCGGVNGSSVMSSSSGSGSTRTTFSLRPLSASVASSLPLWLRAAALGHPSRMLARSWHHQSSRGETARGTPRLSAQSTAVAAAGSSSQGMENYDGATSASSVAARSASQARHVSSLPSSPGGRSWQGYTGEPPQPQQHDYEECALLRELRAMRTRMTRHIAHCPCCLPRSVDVCLTCCLAAGGKDEMDGVLGFMEAQMDSVARGMSTVASARSEGVRAPPLSSPSLPFSFFSSNCAPTVRDISSPIAFLSTLPPNVQASVVVSYDVLHTWCCAACGACYHAECGGAGFGARSRRWECPLCGEFALVASSALNEKAKEKAQHTQTEEKNTRECIGEYCE